MRKAIIATIALLGIALNGYAQYADEATTRKLREYMVMDGDNPNFIRAQQQSLNRLTFGLAAPGEKGEGAYELRASCIWLVESEYQQDRPIARLIADEGAGVLIFVRTDAEDCSIPEGEDMEVIGALNIDYGDIYFGANKSQPNAMIAASGEVSANGKALLRIDKADRRLVAFYLLEYYLPKYSPQMLRTDL